MCKYCSGTEEYREITSCSFPIKVVDFIVDEITATLYINESNKLIFIIDHADGRTINRTELPYKYCMVCGKQLKEEDDSK